MKGKQKYKKALRASISPMFILFFIIAFVLWYISRLSHTYTTTIEVDVVLNTDYNSSMAVETPTVKVELLAEGDGRELMLYKFGVGSEIHIPTSELELTPATATPAPYDYLISETSMLQAIGQYQNDFKVMMITDTIPRVKISEIREKSVPVVANFDIDYAPQFTLSSEVRIDPETVIIKAPQSVLDTLSRVYTAPLTFHKLRKTTSGVVEIQAPQDALGPEDMVRYHIPVAAYVEVEHKLKIAAPTNKNSLMVPSNVELRITMPIEAKEINLAELKATCESTPHSLDGLVHKVVVEGLPSDMIKYSIEPEFVEVYDIK